MADASVVQNAQYVQAVSLCEVACVALVAYDYILTFHKELNYIWGYKWTPGKIVFLIVRYVVFIDFPVLLYAQFTRQPDLMSCGFAMHWYSWSSAIILIVAHLVLALRTWAIWTRSKVVGSGLLVALAAASGMTLYEAARNNALYATGVFSGESGCAEIAHYYTSSSTLDSYITSTVYESIIFAATVIQGVQKVWFGSRSNLTSVLYRDAFLFSACFFALTIPNVYYASGSTDYYHIPNTIHRAFCAILPGRIILNIRQAAVGLDDWDVTTDQPPDFVNPLRLKDTRVSTWNDASTSEEDE